ncbi:MAG: phosphatidylcholine/phosphatidylserine synthase [Nevskia sp.]|nr:phosphatidylcholine/phosphatidylserine synthase [Nevskia sp.]
MPETPVRRPRRRGIYLLPNLITTGTLVGGFYAVVSAMSGRFDHAGLGILFAMLMDSADGRIARWTGTTSDFGKEYDSLCDMAAFGIASSIVLYAFSLHLIPYRWFGIRMGGVIALAYAACAALRLARFNVHASIAGSSKDFFGLPSPAAAGLVVFFAWSAVDLGLDGSEVLVPASVLTLAAAVLMVSNIRYSSFKKLNVRQRIRFAPFVAVLGGLWLLLVLAGTRPARLLFLLFFCYALSGPLLALWYRRRGKTATPRAPG